MYVEVTATVIATVEERWVLKLRAREGRKLIADPSRFYRLMDQNVGQVDVVELENTDIYDEEDRTIRGTRIIPRSEWPQP